MNRLGRPMEEPRPRAPHPEVPHLGLLAELQRCLAENRASYEYALRHVVVPGRGPGTALAACLHGKDSS